MLAPIKKILGETTVWPNRKVVEVVRTTKDGNEYTGTVSVIELNLITALAELNAVLPEQEIAKLRGLIEDYGQEMYSLGLDEMESEN